MSAADDRENAIIKEARELRDFYRGHGLKTIVRLFAEDYDFLKKRKSIKPHLPVGEEIGGLDSVEILRGPAKKKARKRKPKESLF